MRPTGLVELRGFEPLTPSMRTRCATGLRHSPRRDGEDSRSCTLREEGVGQSPTARRRSTRTSPVTMPSGVSRRPGAASADPAGSAPSGRRSRRARPRSRWPEVQAPGLVRSMTRTERGAFGRGHVRRQRHRDRLPHLLGHRVVEPLGRTGPAPSRRPSRPPRPASVVDSVLVERDVRRARRRSATGARMLVDPAGGHGAAGPPRAGSRRTAAARARRAASSRLRGAPGGDRAPAATKPASSTNGQQRGPRAGRP